MRLIGYLLAGCVLLAAAKATIIILLLISTILLIVAIANDPGNMLRVFAGLTLLGMLNAHPLAALATVALLSAASILISATDPNGGQS